MDRIQNVVIGESFVNLSAYHADTEFCLEDLMSRVVAALLFMLVSTLVHANDFEDADKTWAAGKPWPSHCGLVQYPYKEGWNVVALGFINKVYAKDEAADTWLKNIASAMQKDASVEVCMMKRGLLQLSGFCKPALVDQEIMGTLKEGDVVAYFYANHGTKRFSTGPGSDGRTTMRVFQKISAADDDTCWVREALVFRRPLADVCFKKVDTALVEHLLTRDFGPRGGAGTEHIGTAPATANEAKAPAESSSGSEAAQAAVPAAAASAAPHQAGPADAAPDGGDR